MLINERDYARRRQSPFWSASRFHLVQFERPQIWFSAETSQAKEKKKKMETNFRRAGKSAHKWKCTIGWRFDSDAITEKNFLVSMMKLAGIKKHKDWIFRNFQTNNYWLYSTQHFPPLSYICCHICMYCICVCLYNQFSSFSVVPQLSSFIN